MTLAYRVRFYAEEIGLEDFDLGYFSTRENAEIAAHKFKDTFLKLCRESPRAIKNQDMLIGIDEIRIDDQERLDRWIYILKTEVFN